MESTAQLYGEWFKSLSVRLTQLRTALGMGPKDKVEYGGTCSNSGCQ